MACNFGTRFIRENSLTGNNPVDSHVAVEVLDSHILGPGAAAAEAAVVESPPSSEPVAYELGQCQVEATAWCDSVVWHEQSDLDDRPTAGEMAALVEAEGRMALVAEDLDLGGSSSKGLAVSGRVWSGAWHRVACLCSDCKTLLKMRPIAGHLRWVVRVYP